MTPPKTALIAIGIATLLDISKGQRVLLIEKEPILFLFYKTPTL